jgi:hypothetical protein
VRVVLIAAAFAACIVMGGCAERSVPVAKAEEGAGRSKIDQFIKHGWDFNLGRNRAKIVQHLGNPVDMKVEKANKTAASSTPPSAIIADEITELDYDGLRIVLYRAAVENMEMLHQLSVTDARYKVKWGLNIGAAKTDVRAVLGKPDEEQANQYVYKTRYGAESYVQFFFAEDRISRIDWLFYIE